MKLRQVAVLIIAVALSACAVLPEPRSDQSTLLVVPVNFERTAGVEIYGRCKLHVLSTSSGGDIDIWVDATPGVSFKPTDALPPGKYKVTEMCFVYYENNERGKPHPIEGLYFETQPGKITILPMMVSYSIEDYSGKYKYMFYWDLEKLSQAKARETLSRMMECKNYAAWELSDATKNSPAIQSALAEL